MQRAVRGCLRRALAARAPRSTYIDTYYARTAVARTTPPRSISDDVSVDVCVIGGGLAGLSAAYGLASRGTRVALLEAAEVGWGASGRNGGFVFAGFPLSMSDIVARVGLDTARSLYALSRQAVFTMRQRAERHRMPGVMPRPGLIEVLRYDSPDEVRRTHEFFTRTLGHERLELWDCARVRSELLTDKYYHALYDPEAFHFHPLNYSLGLMDAARELGAVVLEHSPVARVEEASAHAGRATHRVVTLNGPAVSARHVVFAGGAYMERELQRKLASANLAIATYVVVTKPLDASTLDSAIRTRAAVLDTRRCGDYFRVLPDHRVLWGGRITVSHEEPPNLAATMIGDLCSVFPQLAGKVEADVAWSGLMPYARHKMLQVGRLRDGVWFMQGFGGHGMNTTTMAGELIAAAIAEGDRSYEMLAPFGLEWTGGPFIGPLVTQLGYWWLQLCDRFSEARSKR
jgi:gamma-glutamylputrescine oxidase